MRKLFIPTKLLFFFLLSNLYAQNTATLLALANEYYNDGEYEKAIEYYDKLVRQNPEGNVFYFRQIFSSYSELGNYAEGIKYFKKQKGKYHYVAKIFLGALLEKQGNLPNAEKIYNEVLSEIPQTRLDVINAANAFTYIGKVQYAIRAYDIFPDSKEFLVPKARLYFYDKNFKKGVLLLLQAAKSNNISYEQVRNFVLNSVREDNIEEIEKALLQLAQEYPREVYLRKLMYHFYSSQGFWREAFEQAKALEKLDKHIICGTYLQDFATLALQNEQEKLAEKSYNEILKKCKNTSSVYLKSLIQLNNIRLDKVLKKQNKDSLLLRQSLNGALSLLKEYGYSSSLLPIYQKVAEIYAFFTPHKDSALYYLNQALSLKLPYEKKAETQLLKAKILLMNDEISQARIVLSEIMKNYRGTEVGTRAKFEFAKLNYYTGNFETAKARASTLKDNPFELIANDAIRLYLLLQDNLGFDSTQAPLKTFAKAQLLTEQYQYGQALDSLDSLQVKYPGHPIQDDIRWQKFFVFKQMQDTARMIFYLENLLREFPTSIWADNAAFELGKIYEKQGDKEKAKEYYLKILKEYSSSIFTKPARIRLRALRKVG